MYWYTMILWLTLVDQSELVSEPWVEVDMAETYTYDGECLKKAEEMGKPGLVDIRWVFAPHFTYNLLHLPYNLLQNKIVFFSSGGPAPLFPRR